MINKVKEFFLKTDININDNEMISKRKTLCNINTTETSKVTESLALCR